MDLLSKWIFIILLFVIVPIKTFNYIHIILVIIKVFVSHLNYKNTFRLIGVVADVFSCAFIVAYII